MGPLRPDDLLAHAASVRRLAAHLLGDAHLGEDVAQDAMVAALERPPTLAPAKVGPWLRGVARHLSFRTIRADARRRGRERAAARPEGGGAAEEDPVERLEARQGVVAALLALDEPYRRTIVLRYFDGLEPTEIARRDGVPAGTVRSRLKRGLDLLRTRLDDRSGGDRAAWAVPLAGLVGATGGTGPPVAAQRLASVTNKAATRAAPLAAGALLMATKWIAAGVVVAALVGGAWFATRDDVAGGGATTAEETAATGTATGSPDTARARAARPAVAATEPAAPVADAPPAKADAWVTGRVVGEGRMPAAGVDVLLVTSYAPPSRTVTGADGAFRVAATFPADPAGASATVHARSRDGRAAVAGTWIVAGTTQVSVGTLVLDAAGPVDVLATADGTPAGGVAVSISSTFRVAATTTGADGRARFEAIPAGAYLLEAGSAEHGHATVSASLPHANGPVVLPMTRREIQVTVVRAGTGEPVPGVGFVGTFQFAAPWGLWAKSYDPPLDGPPTGADGRTTLRGAGRDDSVALGFRPAAGDASAGPRWRRSDVARLRAGETNVRIEVPAPHTYRFRIVPGEVAPPAEGTTLRLVPWTNSGQPVPAETAVVRNGEVVVEADCAEMANCFAQAPDGSLAKLWGKPDGPEVGETSFRAERRIEIVLRNADATPRSDQWVVARDPGNNPIVPPVATDADGVATIRGLYGWQANVYLVSGPQDSWGVERIGSVDLEKGSGRIEFTLVPSVRGNLHVTIDGRPGLPTRYALAGVTPYPDGEDPVAGTLAFSMRRGDGTAATLVRLTADGFQPVRLTIAADAEEPILLAADLRPAGVLVGRVLPAADQRQQVGVQVWSETLRAWQSTATGRGWGVAVDPDGRVRVGELAPGRYRLSDATSGVHGPEVEMKAGVAADAGTLDLSRSGWVVGRVVVPEGASAAGSFVVVSGDDVALRGAGPDGPGAVDENGGFLVRVPGDRPIRLSVTHPTLRAASVGGTVDVTAPRSDVELRLERGPVVTLRAQEAVATPFGTSRPRVLLFDGEPVGKPAAEIAPAVEDGALRFAAPPPGRATLWIDLMPWAPLVLRDVVVGDGDLDLGRCEFPRGSSVRVRLHVKEGQSAPRAFVSATPLSGPWYARIARSSGEPDVVVGGLGAGRFKVTIRGVGDDGGTGASPLERTVEVDGAAGTEVVVDVDVK